MKKFNIKKLIAIALMSVTCIGIFPTAASAAWKENNSGWWYTEGNSWATGWRNIDGNWYYFYSDGYMAKDTTIDGYNLNSSGAWTNDVSKTYNYSYDDCLQIGKAFFSNSHMSGYKFTTQSNRSLNSSNEYYFEFYNTNAQKVDWCYVNANTGAVRN